jgi:hypothetical protein
MDNVKALEAAALALMPPVSSGNLKMDLRSAAKRCVTAYLSALAEDEATVERVARAICADEYGDPDGFASITLDDTERTTPRWNYCRGSARAALAALKAEGG